MVPWSQSGSTGRCPSSRGGGPWTRYGSVSWKGSGPNSVNFTCPEKISIKENKIRRVLEDVVRKEIHKRRMDSKHFGFRRLDEFFTELIHDHSYPKKDPGDLGAKHELLAGLFTKLTRERPLSKIHGALLPARLSLRPYYLPTWLCSPLWSGQSCHNGSSPVSSTFSESDLSFLITLHSANSFVVFSSGCISLGEFIVLFFLTLF